MKVPTADYRAWRWLFSALLGLVLAIGMLGCEEEGRWNPLRASEGR